MEVNNVEFVASYPRVNECPKDGKPEFAFIGRSNVGKSSLINMLTRKGLAKVSATPGKTRLLNYFLVNHNWYLVDLPGYGYARVSKTQQKMLAGEPYDPLEPELVELFSDPGGVDVRLRFDRLKYPAYQN